MPVRGGGAGRGGGKDVHPHEGTLVVRLLRAFRQNPWTLVTLLSVVATIFSIIESIAKIFGYDLVDYQEF